MHAKFLLGDKGDRLKSEDSSFLNNYVKKVTTTVKDTLTSRKELRAKFKENFVIEADEGNKDPEFDMSSCLKTLETLPRAPKSNCNLLLSEVLKNTQEVFDLKHRKPYACTNLKLRSLATMGGGKKRLSQESSSMGRVHTEPISNGGINILSSGSNS